MYLLGVRGLCLLTLLALVASAFPSALFADETSTSSPDIVTPATTTPAVDPVPVAGSSTPPSAFTTPDSTPVSTTTESNVSTTSVEGTGVSPALFEALSAPQTYAPTVIGTVISGTADASWNPDGWSGNYSYITELWNDRFYKAEGALTNIVMPLGYTFDAPGFPVYFALVDPYGNIDCHTPEKTLAEWGVYNHSLGQHWNTVDIGPFSGPNCDTSHLFGRDRIYFRALNSDLHDVSGNLGAPGYQNPDTGFTDIPFVAYSTPTTTPACTENCNSSVLFLPGLKGSVLETGAETLWPADSSGAGLQKLALNADGTSVNNVLVDGILPSFKIHIPLLGDVGPEIYSGFMSFMDGLVVSGTIKEWEALPYDWRFSPEYIVSHDVQTPHGPVNLIAEVERMASTTHSRTGKVTIVGHSMGGLVGKALIEALAAKGEANLIDSFVMVGTPELGTPQAVSSLLHGDQEGIPGKTLVPNFITTGYVVRQVGRDMPGSYSLLPSPKYFEKVTDPTLSFDNVFFTQAWRNYWGSSINQYLPFAQFLTGTGAPRTRPNPVITSVPEVLRPDLVAGAKSLHDNLDNYTIPTNIRVVEIAGWGDETTKAINYQTDHLVQSYDAVSTIEGDGVVVYPSATAIGKEDYYLNLSLLNKDSSLNFDHGTLLNSSSVEETIKKILLQQTVSGIDYITTEKPLISTQGKMLKVSSHSPVILGAYDEHGNFTGVYPNQDLSAAYLYVQRNIPGSNFTTSGDVQSIYLPKEGTYTLVYKGTGSGPTTVTIDNFSDDSITSISSYVDIPTTVTTKASLTFNAATPENAHIAIDANGDGTTDTYFASADNPLSLAEIITNLRTVVNELSTPKQNQKTQLLNRIANIETKIAKQQQKQTNLLAQLQAQVAKKAGKGKIDTDAANTLSSLLDDLITQAMSVPLDSDLLQQLKDEINSANIKAQLKTNLLVKVVRIENLAGLSRALDVMVHSIKNKSIKGILADTDTQVLLNLLDQLQAAL